MSLLVLLGAGCGGPSVYDCGGASSLCRQGAVEGVCLAAPGGHYCAHDDGACSPSLRRWDTTAGGGLAGQCVSADLVDAGGGSDGGGGPDGATLPLMWSTANSHTTSDVYAVWGDGKLWCIAGSAGTVGRSSDGGMTFTVSTTATTDTVWRALYSGAAGEVLLAGDGGLLMRSTDGCATWNSVLSAAPYNWNSISGSGGSAGDVYLAGSDMNNQQGYVMWRQAGVLKKLATDASWPPLNAVVRLSSNDVYAVGADGVALRSSDAGQSWSKEPSLQPPGAAVTSLWTDGTMAMAAGDAGALYTRASPTVQWMALPRATTRNLFGLGRRGADAWAAGDFATVVHAATGKSNLEGVPDVFGITLHGVYATAGAVLIVGESGIVLVRN